MCSSDTRARVRDEEWKARQVIAAPVVIAVAIIALLVWWLVA
jgi:hypothetical protein